MVTFSKQLHVRQGRVEVLGAVVGNLAEPLHGLGYYLVAQSVDGVTFKASAWRSGLHRIGQRITMSFARVARRFNELDLDSLS